MRKIVEYIKLKYESTKDDLICIFQVKSHDNLRLASKKIAIESSTSTWTKIPNPKEINERVKKISAKVFEISKKNNLIKIAYPSELFEEGNIPEILSSIAGNIFGMRELSKLILEDVIFPKRIVKTFPGPRYGIDGVRKILGVKDRPLIGAIVKPKLGLTPSEFAKEAYKAWIGGCDIVKDDENLTNQRFNRFEKRLELTVKMKNKAEKETGEKKVYMPNITAETFEMLRRNKLVEKTKNSHIMFDLITCGFSAAQTLRQNTTRVIHAHRAMHGVLTREDDKFGISMEAIAKFARLAGVDQIHTGTGVGKMEGTRKEISEINHAILEPMFGLKRVFPVASGGLCPVHIEKLMRIVGKDVIIQAGGGILGHPKGTIAGATAMRQAVDAVMKNIHAKEYAKTHKELAQALEYWRKVI